MRNVFLVLTLFLIPLVAADPSFTFRQYDLVNLKIPVIDSNNSPVDYTSSCNITIRDTEDNVLVNSESMTYNDGGLFNYTLTNTSDLGEYPTSVSCTNNADNGFTIFTFEVTPTGDVQKSILENAVMIVFGLLAVFLLVLGIYTGVPWLGFMGSIMFLLGGIYTMIYGFNNITDMYTRGVGVTLLGVGLIFMFSSAYEWISGEE